MFYSTFILIPNTVLPNFKQKCEHLILHNLKYSFLTVNIANSCREFCTLSQIRIDVKLLPVVSIIIRVIEPSSQL